MDQWWNDDWQHETKNLLHCYLMIINPTRISLGLHSEKVGSLVMTHTYKEFFKHKYISFKMLPVVLSS